MRSIAKVNHFSSRGKTLKEDYRAPKKGVSMKRMLMVGKVIGGKGYSARSQSEEEIIDYKDDLLDRLETIRVSAQMELDNLEYDMIKAEQDREEKANYYYYIARTNEDRSRIRALTWLAYNVSIL